VLKYSLVCHLCFRPSADLRRTCTKLCREAGGDLEQIKFLLGHSSIQTTERYLGSEQEIVVAVNDNLGL
jgi:integrase